MTSIRRTALLLLSSGMLFVASVSAQTLKIATLAPEGSDWMTALKAAGAEIEAQSAGRVKLKFYGGGVQGSDQIVIRKIRAGQLHGFTTTGGGLAALHKDLGIYSLPLVFNDAGEANYVRERMDSDLRRELESAGWVNFGFTFSGFAHLMSNRPVRSLDDLDKLRIWVPEDDRIGFDALRTLGGAPVQMPITDVMTGLQTDLLDTVVASAMGAVVLQWHGQVRYVTELPLVYLYSALVIHSEPFGRLAPDDQAAVRRTLEATHRRLDQDGAGNDDAFMSALIGSGVEPLQVDPAQALSWRQRVLASNRRLAEQGEVSPDRLNELEHHLATYRARLEVAVVDGEERRP